VADAALTEVRASVRALWASIGRCADWMSRPAVADLERCVAVCGALRADTPDDRVLVLVGQLEELARDPDPAWSTVGAIASVLGDLDAALAAGQR
jgi:hypothetical protein